MSTNETTFNVPEWIKIMPPIDQTAWGDIQHEFKSGGMRLLLDYDHFSEDPNKSSEAAGWITDIKRSSDGSVWGKIQYSNGGRSAVAGGRYRGVSPAWLAEDIGNGRARPFKLKSVALTNCPKFPDMFLNRGDGSELDYRLELCTYLGLDSNASDREIRQALDAIQHPPHAAKQKPSLKDKVAMSNRAFATLANRLRQGKSLAQLRQVAAMYPRNGVMRKLILSHTH